MTQEESIQQIHAKLASMAKFINLDQFIQGEKNSLDQIRSYFRINAWAYRHYHSQDGFMHFRISPSGKLEEKDVYHHPDSISQLIKEGDLVMELGFGQGANLCYLANKHPNARFYGIDLSTLKKKEVPQNVTTFQQDYSDLSRFEDDSVDVIYAIETIVHNTDKEKIYNEVRRVLKPAGVVVVYDYALVADLSTYDPVLQKAIALISKGGAAAMIESLEQLNQHYSNCGLKLVEDIDYTKEVKPDLKRLEQKAEKVMGRTKLAKVLFKTFPEQFVSNIILGYLGYDSSNAGMITYQKWVLTK